MEPLLYLVHRIPYPPNKGDKIRSFHLLKYLAQSYKIYLGTFIDDAGDEEYLGELDKYCEERCVCRLNSTIATIKSTVGLIKNTALTIPYYYNAELKVWVDRIIKENSIHKAVVFSSSMAQYVSGEKYAHMKRIVDFVDVDSDKWRQYSDIKQHLMRWLYRRESDFLLRFEVRTAREFDKSFFVSPTETTLFQTRCPDIKHKVDYYNNGVDLEYFSGRLKLDSPYSTNNRAIVFTGAMDYWANVDAVSWFVQEVLPIVKRQQDDIKFYIVGSNPTDAVCRLQIHDSVVVTGTVSDVRPFVKYADLIVAPLRIARGIQNKVLEAMAMAKPIVATPAALEGIEDCANYKNKGYETAANFAEACIEVLRLDKDTVPEARTCVQQNYNWGINLQRLGVALGDDSLQGEEVRHSVV